MDHYHVYAYLREDGSPYYIGKGKDRWRWTQNHVAKIPPKERLRIVADYLTNEEACAKEIALIKLLGRKDLGTGILRNLTDGGEGAPGRIYTEEMRIKQRSKMKGRSGPPMSEEGKKRLSKSMKGNTRTLGKSWKKQNYKIYCKQLNKWWNSSRICYEDLGVSKDNFYNSLRRDVPLNGLTFEKVWI
jgi:hypothetical protein